MMKTTFTKTANPREWTLTHTFTHALFEDGGAGLASTDFCTIVFNTHGTLGSTTAGADDLVFTAAYNSNTGTTADRVGVTLNLGTLATAASSGPSLASRSAKTGP
jgi:hypothetical protein